MKPGAENAKSIIWGISPWSRFWSMGEGKGMFSYYYGVKAFVDAGHEIHLFALNDGASKEEETYEGIHIQRFKVPMERQIRALQGITGRIKYLGFIGTGLLQLLYVSLYTLAAIRRAKREGKRARPSLIYAYSSYSAPAAWILSGCYHIPNITRLFGVMNLYKALSSPLWRLSQWQGVLAFKLPCKYLIVTNDGTQGDKVAQKLGVPTKRLRFWRNGVNKKLGCMELNVAAFKSSIGIRPSSKVILTLSRLSRGKGIDIAIKAMPTIISDNEETVLVIAGEGREREYLEKLAKQLGVDKHVVFVGAVLRTEIPKYILSSDLLYCTWTINPVYEGMVCGKCVITSNLGSTDKLIENGRNGILLDEVNPEKVAEIVSKLLKDDMLRESIGVNARKYALKHFWTIEERQEAEVNLIEDVIKYKHGGITDGF